METSRVVLGLLGWKRGEHGPSESLFLLLEVKWALTWVSVPILQAVHAGMRALIYNSSTGGSQAEQSGMRTYYFSADTQEDMNAWVRAMNQAAQVLSRSSLKRSVPLKGSCHCFLLWDQDPNKNSWVPNFHHSSTCIKHCPLFEVFLNNDFFREENAYMASTHCLSELEGLLEVI